MKYVRINQRFQAIDQIESVKLLLLLFPRNIDFEKYKFYLKHNSTARVLSLRQRPFSLDRRRDRSVACSLARSLASLSTAALIYIDVFEVQIMTLLLGGAFPAYLSGDLHFTRTLHRHRRRRRHRRRPRPAVARSPAK